MIAALSAMIPVDSLAQEGTAEGGPATTAATPAAATPAAPTESQPDFWSRPTLSGDWWGARSELADHGVNLRLFATGFHQGQWTGEAGVFTADDGRGTRFLTGGRLDALIDFDTTRLGLWRGGGFHVHLELEGGRVPGFRGGALWPVSTGAVLPLDSPEELEATSLYDSQRWGGTSLLLGKVNAHHHPPAATFANGQDPCIGSGA